MTVERKAISIVREKLESQGFSVIKGYNGCDLVALKDGKELKIEVKGMRKSNGFVQVNSDNTNKQDIKEIGNNWQLWIVPHEEDLYYEPIVLNKNEVLERIRKEIIYWEIPFGRKYGDVFNEISTV